MGKEGKEPKTLPFGWVSNEEGNKNHVTLLENFILAPELSCDVGSY